MEQKTISPKLRLNIGECHAHVYKITKEFKEKMEKKAKEMEKKGLSALAVPLIEPAVPLIEETTFGTYTRQDGKVIQTADVVFDNGWKYTVSESRFWPKK